MSDQSKIMYDILNKMIDSQISHSSLLSNLVKITEENKYRTENIDKQLVKYIQEIKDHINEEDEKFVNLLREMKEKMASNSIEIDDHFASLEEKINNILEEKNDTKNEETERNKRIDKYISNQRQISTYIKWIIAVLVSAATIIAGVATITEFYHDHLMNNNQKNVDNKEEANKGIDTNK